MRCPRYAVLLFFVAMAGFALVVAPIPPAGIAAAPKTYRADDRETWNYLATDKDLAEIVSLQIADLNEITKASSLFNKARKDVATIGRVVAVAGNIGTMALEEEADRKKAAALRDAGLALAAAAAKDQNYEEAKRFVGVIGGYPDRIEPAESDEPASWEKVITSSTLMKQVARIDALLEPAQKLDSRGFRKEAKDLAFHSLLLTHLAVIEREKQQAEDWHGWCDEMRVLTLKMAKAYYKRNQEKSRQCYKELRSVCDACHQVYRSN